ncbi:MAG: glycosyltransferase [Gammaproteobacteria bacterium]|nr:glycosyltransferase [Gammaproteobacteria bacterium]
MALLIHAPNVHVGGGLRLLRDLLAALPEDCRFLQLDERVRGRVGIPAHITVSWVAPSILARLAAEGRLRAEVEPGDTVLCFHGMPPLTRLPGTIVVFVQNRILLGRGSLAGFSAFVRFRLTVERLWCRWFRGNVDRYVVQTPSMARDLQGWHGGQVAIKVAPFIGDISKPSATAKTGPDYIYIASAEPHKNHVRLIDAWVLLAQQGLFPSLLLTVDESKTQLIEQIESARTEYKANIINCGSLSHDEVLQLYASAGALVYPSLSESFGLPLVEAQAFDLPIIASELDYVRDVAEPVQSFDPCSPVSIARAVRRHMAVAGQPLVIHTAAAFFREVRTH